jgi:hypothetical protein
VSDNPENLAAIRGIADINYKRGAFPKALEFYRTALGLAKNDPELEQSLAAIHVTRPDASP